MARLIEINLLPTELQVQDKPKKQMLSAFPSPFVIIAVVAGIVCAVHLYLGTILMIKGNTLKNLNAEWDSLAVQREKLKTYDSIYASLTRQATIAERMASERILWAFKLNALSSHLPTGIWFREIEVANDNFVLHGTVISTDREEISLIREFVDKLQKDREFIKDFKSFELRSVQKRKIVYHDVSDFILVGGLRSKSQ